jgi:uncharacterized membrane protein YczE
MERRIPVLLLSVILMGLCVAVFDQIQFGTDPCTVFNLGISRNVLGWNNLGPWQLIFNVVLLTVILLMREGRRIGLGSLANMVLVGFAKDFFDWVINSIHPLTGAPLGVCIAAFIPTMALFLVAVSFYMCVELGVAPYDAIPQIIASRVKKIPFAPIRMAFDISVTVIGFLLDSTVGVVTIITGFCLGPIIQIIADRVRPWFE